MDTNNRSTPISNFTLSQPVEQTQLKSFMANVFTLMFVALGITAVVAYVFAGSPTLLSNLLSSTGGFNGLGYLVLFSPLIFVLIMRFAYAKLSAPLLMLLFVLYSAINGITFGFILLLYAPGSILGCFLSSAAMFGIMAFMGYTTKQDLTKFGRILIMGLIGIIIASIINFF